MSGHSDGWQQQSTKRRKGTLSSRLLDLAVETGRGDVLDMARKAKHGDLGEAQVTKAWKLVGGKAKNSDTHKGKGKGRGKGQASGGSTKAADQKALAAEQRAQEAERRAAAAERRTQAAERRTKAAAGDAGAADATVAAASPGAAWTCLYCGGAHRKSGEACRICGTACVIDAEEPDDLMGAAQRSPEAIQADTTRLQCLKASLSIEGLSTEDLDKKIKCLEREAAGPPKKLPHNHFENCRKVANRAATFAQNLEEKRAHIESRLSELEVDLEAAHFGLVKAQSAQLAAEQALDEAAAALRRAPDAEASDPRLQPAALNMEALRNVVTDLETIYDKLQAGGCAALIPSAQQEFEEYLSGRNGDAGSLDFELWQQRRVAEMLHQRVLLKCQAMFETAPGPTPVPPQSETPPPGAVARAAAVFGAAVDDAATAGRRPVTAAPAAQTAAKAASTAAAMRAAQKETLKGQARAES